MHDEDRTAIYDHENQKAEFKADDFLVAQDMLICKITRSETSKKINSTVLFIWNSATNDANFSITKA